MRVFLTGLNSSQTPAHNLHVCPANDPQGMDAAEAPSEWWDMDPNTHAPFPKNITVRFEYGEAVVPSNLGQYLVKRGLASKTRFIRVRDGLAA